MRRLAGEWVVLEGDQLIAHGKNATRVFTTAKRKGIAVPFVFYVEPPATEGIVQFGL